MEVRRVAGIVAGTLLLVGGLASPALADPPADALRSAVDRTAAAKTARISVHQRAATGARIFESTATGLLAAADSDLVVTGEGGKARRVSIGTKVHERRPDSPDAPWRVTSRPAPRQTTPFALTTLKDGTSIGDPRLYRSVVEAGSEALPQGQARKLVGDLDMAAVAGAMQLTTSERARMAQWQGTLTLWVTADGKVARNSLRVVIPNASGQPTTLDVTIDLSDLDGPLTVSAP